MPKRNDIKTILLIGAGPIVIGQACEFDYSGVQACRALREEGYRVILVNSNPATIMTDPDTADVIYIEPVHWKIVEEIIRIERPDAVLPTMGGQTALNCVLDLAREGVLEKYGVEMIGASRDAIDKAEDRERFRQAMLKINLNVPHAAIAHSIEEALQVQVQLGFPCIIRPSFTLGGSGSGIAYNREEFVAICENGFDLSPTHELLIEESVLGWKEYELEVVRDREDNAIIVCSIENFDPMGVHTGDSITVAPAQTLTDKEYQILRQAALDVVREIGVDTGGANVQFAINPQDGRMIVIEMNPRVSRSSALASKATGFPIAKVAAKLAVGYTLDELRNEITGGVIPAAFEPAIDYVVTKIPRFNFEKFVQADSRLTTQMKSVGEAMAIGRTFQESLQKALRSLEINVDGLDPIVTVDAEGDFLDQIRAQLRTPRAERIWYIADAFRHGLSLEEIHRLSAVDPWFLAQIEELVDCEAEVAKVGFAGLDGTMLYRMKRKGFSDRRLAKLTQVSEETLRTHRQQLNIHPVYKRVDSCSGEFASSTAYLYSTYEQECEAAPSHRKKIMVLGGGPNRIGQGIEFDYCCVHAALAMREAGYETIMVNCNPETVSTDFDISDRLYFEPLTLEDVLEIAALEKPDGVIVQFGGQTPLKLAKALTKAGVPIIGTSADAIDRAEDRQRFLDVVNKLQLNQSPSAIAHDVDGGLLAAKQLKYPLMVRPSYVLGGRAMEVVYNEEELKCYLRNAVSVSDNSPVLLDHFLDDAIEVDVDAICDGQQVFIAGIMEHIEQAGVHSGDSACSLPPFSLSPAILQQLREQVTKIARELEVVGLVNVQFAIQKNVIYVLEVNPRAARTVPFVSKTTGVPLAKVAALVMVGISLKEQGYTQSVTLPYYAVKLPVFPFVKFPGVDPILGPEMKSTGEVMGVGQSFGEAYAKGQWGCGGGMNNIPNPGRVFLSVRDADKPHIVDVAKDLVTAGFELVATGGTQTILVNAGLPCQRVNKVMEGRPHVVDMIKNDEIEFIVNTTEGKQAIADSYTIRCSALQHKICYTTTLAGARATILAMQYKGVDSVVSLRDLHDSLSFSEKI